MLYNGVCPFLPYISTNQPLVYTCPLPLGPPSHLPPLLVVTEHQFELPESCSKFPVAIYSTSGEVYVFMVLSPFIPPSPSPTVSTSLFSLCLHCCLADGFIRTIFLVCTHVNAGYRLCSARSLRALGSFHVVALPSPRSLESSPFLLSVGKENLEVCAETALLCFTPANIPLTKSSHVILPACKEVWEM